ncbi:MAG: hypothetical protein JHD28_03835 [Bacteroidia bacterium]|nr:hypothetical protein [Bacteroidia bacterium]
MSYQILIEKDAEKDIDDIISWYEKEQAGLGVSFIKYFEAAIACLNASTFVPCI